MKCISCGKELVEDNNCDKENGERYMKEGQGPFCDSCLDEAEYRNLINS